MNPGAFVWYDLATIDPEAASRFYQSVVGWAVEPVSEMHYTLLKAGETRAAGLMELPPHLREAGVPPHWTGYIHVSDVDGMAEKVKQSGGSLKFGPEDIPGVGRFAVVTDPDQAPFDLFKPTGEGGSEPAPMTPGHVGWHELRARDHEAAFGFYSRLFGWSRSRAMDMGPMGTYQVFGYDGADRGGIMNAPDGLHPSWLFYFVVAGLDAALGRVQAGGGTVMHGPQEVPGGAWVLTCRDPQGAAFALVSAKR
jgi:predicted enzyme related to lactoylglutathione lyase